MDEKERAEYIKSKRRGEERLIMNILFTLSILALWIIVIGTNFENNVINIILGATTTAWVLIVQFYNRKSGDK